MLQKKYLDEDGYLFIMDRRAFTIISCGVNIYSQEVENVLALHPAISEVGVISAADSEYGQSVKAVVQLEGGVEGTGAHRQARQTEDRGTLPGASRVAQRGRSRTAEVPVT